jgi:hypothetical protein
MNESRREMSRISKLFLDRDQATVEEALARVALTP